MFEKVQYNMQLKFINYNIGVILTTSVYRYFIICVIMILSSDNQQLLSLYQN